MTTETLLVIFVGVTAIALTVQSVFVVLLSRSTRRLVERISDTSRTLEQDTRQIVAEFQELVESLESLRRVSENVVTASDSIGRMLDERTRDVGRLFEVLVDVGKKQAEKIDEVVTSTVNKFEQTTSLIQEDILKPVVEISSLVRGVKSGVDFLFAKKSSRSEREDYPDEEMFI